MKATDNRKQFYKYLNSVGMKNEATEYVQAYPELILDALAERVKELADVVCTSNAPEAKFQDSVAYRAACVANLARIIAEHPKKRVSRKTVVKGRQKKKRL